jgi:DNA-binding transcriptional regulator YhcF (GntR family)
MDKKLFADTTWFHVFKNMIDSGELAKLKPTNFTVYCVLKAHVNFNTGQSFPSQELIAKKAGITLRAVQRAIRELVKLGYIQKHKHWRRNIYTLKERIRITDMERTITTENAEFDYIPSLVDQAREEIKKYLQTGDKSSTTIVNIEKIVIEQPVVLIADTINLTDALSSVKDQALREQIEKLIESRKQK